MTAYLRERTTVKNAANILLSHGQDRRAVDRTDLGRPGTLRIGDVAPTEIVVADLTRDGCRISTEVALSARDIVSIGLPGVGIVTAQIIWYGPSGYGCEFVTQLPSGAVTAAFLPCNIHRLDRPGHDTASRAAPPLMIEKWPARRRALCLGMASLTAWAVIAIGVAALSR